MVGYPALLTNIRLGYQSFKSTGIWGLFNKKHCEFVIYSKWLDFVTANVFSMVSHKHTSLDKPTSLLRNRYITKL
jgi:hypothetical protein